jgi:hypothetical protein
VLSQSWNNLEARIGKEWLDTLTGKVPQEDRKRQAALPEQSKKSTYMGKEEVWERIWFI